ncbi:CYFA0S01e04302g1_1 [Cyberlindnera fabianii]|uniref:Exosome complex component RRP45 n=1 Tax=Cyberlindnera fabianii TaxID=36022 RepID=A0A061AI07_CYBFA|nr:Exosome complex component RRP45 [Cyberlindnera fabianii]CDR36769.1 CYFA0S01e04302g1_1 [Cyberlindnera fabianii]
MAKGIEVSTNEREFVLEALRQGIRTDGRNLDEPRPVEITLHEQYGFVEVKMGKTRVVCRISAEIVAPFEDRPFEGLFHVSTEISPMASPMFENGRQSDDELLISRAIEKAVRRSGALDLESLCIIAGSKCWAIRADIHFLDYDGGFIDASCIAVMTGLQHFKKNDVSVSGEQVIVHSVEEREPVELSILHVPICVSFAFFNPNGVEENIKGDANEIYVVDANLQEDLLNDGILTVTINKNREVCQISKAGGLPMDALMLMECSQKAYAIAEKLTNQIKDLLEKDEAKRRAGIQWKELSAQNDR